MANKAPENPASDICDTCIDIENGILNDIYIDDSGDGFD